MDMLSKFHRRERLNKKINATFVTLLPKVPYPVELKDFLPISLVGCVYKLLSKILANRLKTVLSSIIEQMQPMQGAFVQNRQILDGILMHMN